VPPTRCCNYSTRAGDGAPAAPPAAQRTALLACRSGSAGPAADCLTCLVDAEARDCPSATWSNCRAVARNAEGRARGGCTLALGTATQEGGPILGVLAARAGDLERGRSLLSDALALFEETHDAPGQMGMRLNLGNVAADAGEPERARELLEASRELAERQSLFRCAGWLTLTLVELAVADGADGPAARRGARAPAFAWRSLGCCPLFRARANGR
jgi:tetratricopeptide repeat protein